MFIDSHCHLTYEPMINNVQLVLNECKKNKISKLLSIATNVLTSKKNIEICKLYKEIYCTVGIHPNEIIMNESFSDIISLAKSSKKVIGIGETGLDYYYNTELSKYQVIIFKKHIDLAYELNKPVIVHTRSAEADTINIIKEKKKKLKNINFLIHCFSGSKNFCEILLDLGCYISFSGMITFKKNLDLQKIVGIVPLNKILIETDSPYLTPEPLRGKPNTPANVYLVAKKIAEIKNETIENIGMHSSRNFNNLFNI